MTTPARLKRLCDLCGGLDDHPRHVFGVPTGFPGAVPSDEFIDKIPDGTPARAIAEVLDPGTLVRHMDCCAATGCDVCTAAEATHSGQLRGPELVAHIESGALDNLNAPKEG